MQFNAGTDTQSIVARMNRICQTGNTTYPLIEKTADANAALDRFWYLAMTADGRWQMDDSNYTNLPIGITNLISGQQDYSFVSDVMMIEKLLAKDQQGNWNELLPVDISQTRSDVHAKNIWELPSNNGGTPMKYDKTFASVLLDPIPNYASTGGLKVVFKRGPSHFIAGDTTKSPGIPVIFHEYIALRAALNFLIDKANVRKNDIATEVNNMEDAITDFYAHRNEDDQPRLQVVRRSSR